MTKSPALEAAEAEAVEVVEPRTFEFGGVTLIAPRKWKRLKFLKLLNLGDIYGAMGVVFGEEQMSQLEDVDMDEADFEGLTESLGNLLAGTAQGN